METKEDLIERRKSYEKAIRELEPMEGKTVGQLSETQRKRVQTTCEETYEHVIIQDIQGRSKTGKQTVDLKDAREELKRIAESIRTIENLESCPSLKEYKKAIDAAIKAMKRLREESGLAGATNLAHRYGLVHGYLNY